MTIIFLRHPGGAARAAGSGTHEATGMEAPGHHQNRGRSGNGSEPRLPCIRPSSAQRCRVGNTLPWFSSPFGSPAPFTLCFFATSTPSLYFVFFFFLVSFLFLLFFLF